MKASSVAFAIAVAFACCSLGEPAFAQGRGIGRSVSQMAKNGVHGPQLAAQVQQLQAGQGIGQVNGGGKGQGMMGGGKGGPPAGKGQGMMGGGKGGPPAGKGQGMMGGGKGGPPAGKGQGMMGGGKGGPQAGKGKPF